jgi:hypothetical protein
VRESVDIIKSMTNEQTTKGTQTMSNTTTHKATRTWNDLSEGYEYSYRGHKIQIPEFIPEWEDKKSKYIVTLYDNDGTGDICEREFFTTLRDAKSFIDWIEAGMP